MKKGKMIGVAVIATGLLTGCVDHMPEMTEEQSALIAEYAADMLLKYSPNYDYKIADEEVLVEEETIEEETTEEITTEPVTETVVVETQLEEKSEEETSESSSDVIKASEVDFAEIFAVEDVEIRYDFMEICSSYPRGEENGGFSVNAVDGNSLLVMHFVIENTSDAVINCDLFEKDFDISTNLNGGNYKKVSNTLLVNDFATYMGEIPVDETREVVIVAEMSEITEDEIDSCILRIASDDASIMTELK